MSNVIDTLGARAPSAMLFQIPMDRWSDSEPKVLHYRTEEEMDAIPIEVSSAFVAIAAGGLLILVGYIINKWRR
jgi:hypothetical protein